MEGVTLSKAVRQNLNAMQSTAKMMSETQNRLATGKKVNSALDNPTNFFTASALDSRASDLNSLMDSVGNAVKTLEAADNGVKAIKKLVESAQGTARQALQAAKGDSNGDGVSATQTSSVTAVSLTADDTLDFSVASGSVHTIKFEAADMASVEASAAKINAEDGLGITASVDGSGKLVLTSDTFGDAITVATGSTGTSGVVAELMGTAVVVAGTAETFADSPTRKTLEAEYDNLLKQIDQLTSDASFNGNNFLDGDDLKVTFNETGTSSLTIKGVDTSSSGLGLSANTTGDFQDETKIEAVLKTLDSAVTKLRSNASTFGSNLSVVQARKDFTANMINTLETGAANLVLADINKEGANLLALQTRQQLSTTALSMASQADQAVLSLF
uniref:Flagellin n=1 Tax=OCS116 cluster bacterium TaxID=2030921 RepID=A0A2A4Z0X1_9PROT